MITQVCESCELTENSSNTADQDLVWFIVLCIVVFFIAVFDWMVTFTYYYWQESPPLLVIVVLDIGALSLVGANAFYEICRDLNIAATVVMGVSISMNLILRRCFASYMRKNRDEKKRDDKIWRRRVDEDDFMYELKEFERRHEDFNIEEYNTYSEESRRQIFEKFVERYNAQFDFPVLREDEKKTKAINEKRTNLMNEIIDIINEERQKKQAKVNNAKANNASNALRFV